MKKLLLIILCCTHIITHANQLSDAIRENDLEAVNLLLSKQKVEPADYAKYIAITEESIQLAREQLLLQRLRPKMSRRYKLLTLGSLCAMAGSTFYFSHKSSPIIMISSSIIMIALILIGFSEQTHYYQQEYDNALKIQDLILGL
jgi:hypothetical protein